MISGNQRRKEELAVLSNHRVVDCWPESRMKCRSSYNRCSDGSSSPLDSDTQKETAAETITSEKKELDR